MPLTPEERAEVNRRNAAKSTGPRTEQGKAASRRNALKHGLRAEALALPNEDPAAVADRSDTWNDYYQPQSPAAQHLVNACVAATLLSDRCDRYHAAALSSQVRKAVDAWDLARDEEVASLADWLKTNPAGAVRRLTHTAHGCRWLIGEWEDLLSALDARGQWTGPERDQAIRLSGLRPEFEALKENPVAWVTRFFALLCADTTTGAAVETMFQAHHMPDLYRGDYSMDSLPLREFCREALRDMVVANLEPLREIEGNLRTFHDEPDRAGVSDRALILHDGPSARLFLRYHAEARTAFHRAYGSLVKTLELDAAGGPAVSPIEAKTPAATPSPAEAVSPDEPDSTPRGDANPAKNFTPGESGGVEPRPHGPEDAAVNAEPWSDLVFGIEPARPVSAWVADETLAALCRG